MREIVLRIPGRAVEEVLDRLLPIVRSGVRETVRGAGHDGEVELSMRGSDLPSLSEVARAAGDWRLHVSERHVSDDWRERRLADYRAELIGGRLVVRPDWAPKHGAELEIVLAEGAAFGAGTHPTTRACLELLLELPTAGSFGDLGCGTGVLAILAAMLGWAPVTAVDIEPGSVASTIANAGSNGVALDAYAADLSMQAPPPADMLAANVPAPLQAALAGRVTVARHRQLLLSGFGPGDTPRVTDAYVKRGFRRRRLLERSGWTIVLLEAA